MRLYILFFLIFGLVACDQKGDANNAKPEGESTTQANDAANNNNAQHTNGAAQGNKPKPRPNISLSAAKPFLESGNYSIKKGTDNTMTVQVKGNHIVGNYVNKHKGKSVCALVFDGTIDGNTQTAKIKAKCAGAGNLVIKGKSITLTFDKAPCGTCSEDYTKGVTFTLFD